MVTQTRPKRERNIPCSSETFRVLLPGSTATAQFAVVEADPEAQVQVKASDEEKLRSEPSVIFEGPIAGVLCSSCRPRAQNTFRAGDQSGIPTPHEAVLEIRVDPVTKSDPIRGRKELQMAGHSIESPFFIPKKGSSVKGKASVVQAPPEANEIVMPRSCCPTVDPQIEADPIFRFHFTGTLSFSEAGNEE